MEITGQVDRLERDAEGRAIVVDLKTGLGPARPPTWTGTRSSGVYQLAVLLGAFERFGLTEPGGAELVQVGKAGLAAQVRVQRQRALADDPEPGWAQELVETVAAGHGGPAVQGQAATRAAAVCPVAVQLPGRTSGRSR